MAERTTSAGPEAKNAKQVYFIAGVYALMVAGGVWASLNLLHWFWHRL